MSIPAQQKTLFLPAKQARLVVRTSEVPKPGPDDVLIKVETTALNSLEWKIQDTGLFLSEYPAVLGVDAAGTVVAVGTNVTDFKIGDQVAAQGGLTPQTGTFQQYFISPAAVVIKLPPNISFDEGATVPICASTAAISLYNPSSEQSAQLVAPWEEGGKAAYAGKPAVVLGGSSSVGKYAIQFLKLSGFSPIITTASPRNAELAKSLGATHVVDRTLPTETILSEVTKLAGGPVGLVFDSISEKETQVLAYDIVAPRGTVVLVVPDMIDPAKKADGKNPKIIFARAELAIPPNIAFSTKWVKVLPGLLADGSLKPSIPEVLPGGLHAIQDGIDRLRAGAVSARKLVVHPQETA